MAIGFRRVAVGALVATGLMVWGSCSAEEGSPTSATGPTGETTSTSPESTSPAVDPEPVDFDPVDAAVDGFVEDEGLNGAALVVVDRDSGIVHEHYAGGFGPERVSLIASSSKMLTAGVLMRLDDQEVLDVDAPIAEVADWAVGAADLTPAQLLSNSSGLVGLIDDPTFPPYLCQYLATGTLEDCARQIVTTDDDDALVVAPDTEFRYGGGQWQLAGGVAEAASGMTWDELIQATYVTPCGVDSLGYNNHFAQTQVVGDASPFSYPSNFDGDPAILTPTDNPNMEGGAYISPTDYAALLLMHLRGGRCGDEQVLSSAAIDRMHTDRVGPAYGGDTGNDRLDGYGLGWWVAGDGSSQVEDAGAFGAVPWLDLDDGYGVYLLVERTATDGHRLAEVIRPMVEARMGTG